MSFAAHEGTRIGVVEGSSTSCLQVDTSQIMKIMIFALKKCTLSVPQDPCNLLNIKLQKLTTNGPCDAQHEVLDCSKCAEHEEVGGPHMKHDAPRYID